MKILAIETSCDETAAAVLEGRGLPAVAGRGQGVKLNVLSNVVASQVAIHKKYGGVVPEVAAREHVLNIIPVVNEALNKAKIKKQNASRQLAAVAVTAGPGLITSLIVGVETAKALAYAWQLPLVPVNHIEGHIYSAFLSRENPLLRQGFGGQANSKISFPIIVLTVSGGHTMLVLMKKHLDYQTIGETRDDAAGEAFDKGAKLLGLGYPGGPAIALAASRDRGQAAAASVIARTPSLPRRPWQSRDRHAPLRSARDDNRIILPRPMINSNDLDFSFSGLKTALLYQLRDDKNWRKKIPAYAAEYQQAIIDVLTAKVIKAAKKYSAKTVILAGGVSANLELRRQFAQAVKKHCPTSDVRYPLADYTTDNAAMIAAAGYFKFRAGKTIAPAKLKVDPNWELK